MSNNTEIENLNRKFSEIIEFYEECESRLGETESKEFKKNYSKVQITLGCIESESNEVKLLNTRIGNIRKEFFKHQGWIILFGVVVLILLSISDLSNGDRLGLLSLGGLYYLMRLNGLNQEINDEKSGINSSQTSIKIFKRDLKLFGVPTECVDKLIDFRSKDSDLYDEDGSRGTDEYYEYRKNKFGNSIVISDYQIKLSVLKFTFDSLGSTYDSEIFKKLISPSYLTSHY